MENVISKVRGEQSAPFVDTTESHQDDFSKSYLLTSFIQGEKKGKFGVFGVVLVCIFPHSDWIWTFFTQWLVHIGTKLDSKHKHDLIYSGKWSEETFNETHNSETGRGLIERIDEHRGKDKNSYVHQHSVNSNHTLVTFDNFTILIFGYKHNKYKRKICEALFIKSNRPNLNKQDASVSLKLFNWYFNIFEVQLFSFLILILTFPNPIIFAVEVYSAVNLHLSLPLILNTLGLFYLFFTFSNFGGVFGAQLNVWDGFFFCENS